MCYVKGRLQPTRALGDLYLKRREFNGTGPGRIPEPFKPPYVSATPEVTLRPRAAGDAFVVLASDGLWDLMSSQEAVDCVAKAHREYLLREAVAASTAAATAAASGSDSSGDGSGSASGAGTGRGAAGSAGRSWWGRGWSSSSSSLASSSSAALGRQSDAQGSLREQQRRAAESGEAAAAALMAEALRRIAAEWGLSALQLEAVPPGYARRQRHDDISIAVLFLK